MDLIDKINALSLRCKSHGKNLTNEEQTKMTLILPFIQMLGYDVFNPLEVVSEYNASMGVKKDARVDYALLKDGEPVILLECKAYGSILDVQKCSQLMQYFHATPAHVGILTDGNIYQLYSDLVETHKMDDKPYVEFCLEDFKEAYVPAIKKLMKESFDLPELQDEALNFMYSRQFKTFFAAQFEEPEDDFIKFFIRKVYDGMITKKQLEKFTPILKRSMASWLNDELNNRLTKAMQKDNPAENQKEPDNGIVTTESETQAHLIVRAILSADMPPEDITMDDCKGFCNILYKDNRKTPIMRLYSKDETVTVASTYDEEGREVKNKITSLNDIYAFTDQLKATVKRYMGG